MARYAPRRSPAQLLSVVPRTIHRMLEEGRLRRVDRRVDVRSICEYIENPKQANFVAKAKNARSRNMMSESDFFAAARQADGAQALRRRAYGQEDASGKFRGKVTIGYDPDGKPIYKYVTARPAGSWKT